jgi:hypothetical protein
MVWRLMLESTVEGTTSFPETPSVIDDVAKVIMITTVLSLLTILSYPLMYVIVNQMPLAGLRMLLHFRLVLPRSIGYRQRARPDGFWLMVLLR